MNAHLLSVGEFSRVTGLSIKTLRFYHEKGLLTPSSIDESSGYRYYDQSKVEQARIIISLRDMEFSLEEIAVILREVQDESDLLIRLEVQKQRIAEKMSRQREVLRALDNLIENEKQARESLRSFGFKVEEKELPAQLIAGFRMKGRYSDCGKGFAHLSKTIGRYISGKPFCLYYDSEYKEEDADYETCFPVRKQVQVEGIVIRTLPSVKCFSLLHRGPYPQLGRSYEKILQTASEREAKLDLPSREVYLKGPGMIFKGNPKNYLTEIQLPFTAD